MKQFLSCDWGTTSFRLRLINAASQKILARIESTQGIAATYALWEKQKNADRILFFTRIISQQIKALEKKGGFLLDNIPIVISGMASSTIGITELAYKSIPYKAGDFTFNTEIIPSSKICKHEIIIISGVQSNNDVMRGEETMLAGSIIKPGKARQLFIFPGTHCKHITLQHSMVKSFRTYMTGELFSLLCKKSILSSSVENNITIHKITAAFIKGVRESIDNNVLNNIFHVRTNELFKKLSKKENYNYLSGLLIGEELKPIIKENYSSVTIVSIGILLSLYTEALIALGYKNKILQKNADQALINGQLLILKHHPNFTK